MSHTISAFFSHQTSPRCPPSRSRCLVSVLAKIVHLGGGKVHSLCLLHCITLIQSSNPDLRDFDCGHSLDDKALQTPIKALLLLVFPLSGFSTQDPPSIQLSCRNHSTCAMVTEKTDGFGSQTATKDSCASGFLPTTGCAAPHQVLSPVPVLCSAEMEQNDGKTPGFLLFVPRWSSPGSFQIFTLSQVDEISHQKLC